MTDAEHIEALPKPIHTIRVEKFDSKSWCCTLSIGDDGMTDEDVITAVAMMVCGLSQASQGSPQEILSATHDYIESPDTDIRLDLDRSQMPE